MKLLKKLLICISKFLNLLINNGLNNKNDIQKRKNVQLINFYTFFLFIYLTILGIINILDKTYLVGSINLIIGFLLILNLIIFKKFKNIKITSNISIILSSIILFYTYISGGKNGTGFIWILFFPFAALMVIELKKATIFFILLIFIQIFFKIFPLYIYNYSQIYKNYDSIFFRLIFIQIILFITTFFFVKNRNALNNEIDKINKQKINLFINLAHETKTPLTLISNYFEKYIKKKGLSEELSVIKNNLDKLIKDMTNYLDIEKLERKQVFYNHNSIIDLSKIIKIKTLFFKEIANKKGIKIKLDISDHIYIKIDPYAIDRIINNLLDNAIKYNNENGITKIILISLKNKIELIIEDTGIGINEEQINYIFNPFYQSSIKKRNLQGIGMGLSIVKKIIDEVKGEINVSSKLNKGTTFKIIFNPYKLKENDQINEEIKYFKPKPTKTKYVLKQTKYIADRYNIFVVEDNIEMLLFLQNSMIDKYNFYYALNGKEALKKLDNIPRPHIIISDIMMDEMDGYTFYENIDNNNKYKSIPFIFLTAKTMEEDRIKGLSKGAIDYISKPFSIDELLVKINSIIKYLESISEVVLKNIGEGIYNYLNNKSNITITAKGNEKDKINYNIIGKLHSEYGITQKELEIISLLKKNLEYKEIGICLNISINTVRTYIKRIFEKCKVRSTRELLRYINNY